VFGCKAHKTAFHNDYIIDKIMKHHNTEITIDAYNKNANRYADKFMDFKSYKEKISIFQKHYLSKNSSILDVGCGPGNNAKSLFESDNTYKISGMDLSTEMIKLAKQNIPDCDFWVQDIRDINPDKKFDAIIASFCIVHLSDEDTAVFVQKLSKMLKEKGSLYLSFMEGKKPGLETTSCSDDHIFFNYYHKDTIKKLLVKNSIEIVEILNDGYQERDGSITQDIFIFARKKERVLRGSFRAKAVFACRKKPKNIHSPIQNLPHCQALK
jgi:2-polyprenyl-3-methyl-5-hydroxy-6-metoxy-1,4-benzoquinol methylase